MSVRSMSTSASGSSASSKSLTPRCSAAHLLSHNHLPPSQPRLHRRESRHRYVEGGAPPDRPLEPPPRSRRHLDDFAIGSKSSLCQSPQHRHMSLTSQGTQVQSPLQHHNSSSLLLRSGRGGSPQNVLSVESRLLPSPLATPLAPSALPTQVPYPRMPSISSVASMYSQHPRHRSSDICACTTSPVQYDMSALLATTSVAGQVQSGSSPAEHSVTDCSPPKYEERPYSSENDCLERCTPSFRLDGSIRTNETIFSPSDKSLTGLDDNLFRTNTSGVESHSPFNSGVDAEFKGKREQGLEWMLEGGVMFFFQKRENNAATDSLCSH